MKQWSVSHQESSSFSFYREQKTSYCADQAGHSKGAESLNHRLRHQHLTKRNIKHGPTGPEGLQQHTELTCAMNGAIIPPIRLNDVQKPIPRDRATVGYT